MWFSVNLVQLKFSFSSPRLQKVLNPERDNDSFNSESDKTDSSRNRAWRGGVALKVRAIDLIKVCYVECN